MRVTPIAVDRYWWTCTEMLNCHYQFLTRSLCIKRNRKSLQNSKVSCIICFFLFQLGIEDVAFDSFSSTLGVVATAAKTSHSSLIFLLYDITLAAWNLLPFYLDASDTYGKFVSKQQIFKPTWSLAHIIYCHCFSHPGRVSLLFVSSARNGSSLFWDEKRLYSTHSNGKHSQYPS